MGSVDLVHTKHESRGFVDVERWSSLAVMCWSENCKVAAEAMLMVTYEKAVERRTVNVYLRCGDKVRSTCIFRAQLNVGRSAEPNGCTQGLKSPPY